MMKTILPALALIVALPAGAALADDDCTVPADQRQSWEAVTQLAEDYDWTINWVEIDDGCYEVRVTDVAGNSIKADIDPTTLEVIKAKIRLKDEAAASVPGETGTAAPDAGTSR